MKKIELPNDYALVLQQVHESGEEDFAGLADSLRFTPGRLAYILQDLAQKHLIVSRNAGYGIWVRLSARGKRFMHTMWPESALVAH
jgi:hypothetical protein